MGPKHHSRGTPTFQSPYEKTNAVMSKFPKPGTAVSPNSDGQGDGLNYQTNVEEYNTLFPSNINEKSVDGTEEFFIDPDESQPPKGLCAVCGLPCKSCCAGCKKVFYCSKKHQQSHWPNHKLKCRPFSVPSQYPAGWNSAGRDNKNKSKDININLELKFMVATREIEGGKTLFSEKPLLILPHYPKISERPESGSKKCCCLGCYKQFPVPGRYVPLDICRRCHLPLCANCLKDSDLLGSSHGREECDAVLDGVAKNRQVMTERIENLGQNPDLVKDFTILRILLLNKSSSRKWQSFIDLKSNPRFGTSVKFPSEGLKEWLAVDYPLSENYLANLKDRSVKLEDVIRIFVVFSGVSYGCSTVRVLYPTQVWIPHACSPNSQSYFKDNDPSHTIYVKTVDKIQPDGVVTMNFLDDYEEGCSKAAIRLFTATGMYCAEPRCSCRMPNAVDKSVGIRCSYFLTTKDSGTSCPGYLCPISTEPPNPEKQNLGLLIFVKSKFWNCNKCRRSEKFSSIQKQFKELTFMLKDEVDSFMKFREDFQGSFTFLKDLLDDYVSEHHWLQLKIRRATLSVWSRIVGNGKEMLCKIPKVPDGQHKSNFMKLVTLKVELYGDGIVEAVGPKSSKTSGVLAVLAKQYGKYSSKRALFLLDAFYANLLVFAENFKERFTSITNRTSTITAAITDAMRCLHILLQLLQDATISIGLFITPEMQKEASVCSKMLRVLTSVCTQATRNRSNVLQFVREFLEVYATHDARFISTVLPKMKPIKDDLEEIFDPEGRQYPVLTFGPVYDAKGGTKKAIPEKEKPPFKGGNDKMGYAKNSKSFDKSFDRSFDKSSEKLPTWDKPESSLSDTDSDFDAYAGLLGDDFEDLDNPFSTSDYYEKLLYNSMRDQIFAEEILKDLFRS